MHDTNSVAILHPVAGDGGAWRAACAGVPASRGDPASGTIRRDGEGLGAMGTGRTITPPCPMSISLVRSKVMTCLHREMGARDVAAIVGLGPAMVRHALVAATGQTPHQLLSSIRLDLAHGLLSANRDVRSVRQRARAFGHRTSASFLASYRKRFGDTPSDAQARHVFIRGDSNSIAI